MISSKLGPMYRIHKDKTVDKPDKFWSVYGYDYSEYFLYHGYHINLVNTGEYCNADNYNKILHVCNPTVGQVSVCMQRKGHFICTE